MKTALFLALLSTSVFAKTLTVRTKGMKFTPAELNIKAGDTVEWINDDTMFHTVTSGENGKQDNKFASPYLAPKKKFSVTFKEAGEFPYFCIPHRIQMKGKVIVK